jgi:hypothetical protein
MIGPDLEQLAHLSASFAGGEFLAGDMLANLTLAVDGALSVVWAPFDYVCKSARVVVVGICPGRTQAENGLLALRAAIRAGSPTEQALRQAKLTGSLSGSMRANFVNMLDHIGLNRALAVESCSDLSGWKLSTPISPQRSGYPVFVNGDNYRGNPDMLETSLLREIIDFTLVEEAEQLPEAVWIPLGPKPAAALRHLAAQGWLNPDRILEGVPHPSGANAERISYFLGRKRAELLSKKTNPDQIDRARDTLRGCRGEAGAPLKIDARRSSGLSASPSSSITRDIGR